MLLRTGNVLYAAGKKLRGVLNMHVLGARVNLIYTQKGVSTNIPPWSNVNKL